MILFFFMSAAGETLRSPFSSLSPPALLCWEKPKTEKFPCTFHNSIFSFSLLLLMSYRDRKRRDNHRQDTRACKSTERSDVKKKRQ